MEQILVVSGTTEGNAPVRALGTYPVQVDVYKRQAVKLPYDLVKFFVSMIFIV